VPSRRAIVAVLSACHDYLECLFRELEDVTDQHPLGRLGVRAFEFFRRGIKKR
jgi:hypothetical protein